MKQKEESDIREKLALEQAAREKAAHWTLETTDADNETMPLVIIEDGVSDNPMLGRSGRQSFGCFNPVLEKRKARPGKGNGTTKEEGEMVDVGAVETTENHAEAASQPRKDEKRDLFRGVRGGIAKKETKPLSYRRHFKKNRPFKGPRFSRPN